MLFNQPKKLVVNTWPILSKIEFGTVFFYMTFAAGRPSLFGESALGVPCMLQARPVTHFTLDILQSGGINFTDKSPRCFEADGVAGQAFGIE